MNSIQRSRLIQLIKQHFPYTDPYDVDHALQWEIIAETLNALGPAQSIDEWIEDWESIKNAANDKLKQANSHETDGKEIPEELKLTEEDHRVIKICRLQKDSDRIAKLVKMLEGREGSPFDDGFSDSEESDKENAKDEAVEKREETKISSEAEDAREHKKIALDQLEEQKKINVQLAELLSILKTPSQN